MLSVVADEALSYVLDTRELFSSKTCVFEQDHRLRGTRYVDPMSAGR